MAFNSLDYILFLVSAFAVFWAVVRLPNLRVIFLLLASYLFYSAWNGALVLLILASSAVDYFCGGLIYRFTDRPRLRKALLTVSVLLNLGLLGFFKYTNFFIDNASAVLALYGIDPGIARLDILLPVGISFYTFQSMSYSLDIYLGVLRPARSMRDFFLFVAFFPQLVAGPIVRAREFLPQLENPPRLDRARLAGGFYRLFRGLIKKMVIADYLAATMVDPVFQNAGAAGGPETLLALVAFHFQVYCDFSGYTDIAIGSAALFGFDLPENFRMPYAAHTPANYWKRWHMTLSRFCFDYLYRPLGGNRRGELRTYVNTLITFAVIGFWHGANWNYVLFGVYHAVGVVGTRVTTGLVARLRRQPRHQVEADLAGRALPILATNLFIIGSLPLFRSPDMPTASVVYNQLLQWDTWSLAFSALSLAVLGVATLSHFVPDRVELTLQRGLARTPVLVQAVVVFLLGAAVLHMATVAQQSFVYFQF